MIDATCAGVCAAIRRGHWGAPERTPSWLTRTAKTNVRGDALQTLPCLQVKSPGESTAVLGARRRATQVSARKNLQPYHSGGGGGARMGDGGGH